VIDPMFDSLPDHIIMYKLSKKLGIDKQLFKHIKVNNDEHLIEDITREFNSGMWTIGYTGQTGSITLSRHCSERLEAVTEP
jgi:formate dehydrogenase major subunit